MSNAALAYEENAMGRFLKEASKLASEKTDAGKMMGVVGKTLSTTGQQRLAFQDPLRGLQKVSRRFKRAVTRYNQHYKLSS